MRYNKKWLVEHEFQPCAWTDKSGKQPHYYRFNVYKSNNDMRIDAEITIYDDDAFDIDVYDGSFGRAKYAPWYSGDDTEIVRKIKKIIDEKIEQLGLYT